VAWASGTTLLLVGGCLVLVATFIWQVRTILLSAYPILREIEALTSAFPLFLLL
jgi:hypothetical protein